MTAQEVFEHIRKNGERYRRDFVNRLPQGDDSPRFLSIHAIKRVHEELGCGLLLASEGVQMWKDWGFPIAKMQRSEARVLVKNLLLRGRGVELTSLELEAVEVLLSIRD